MKTLSLLDQDLLISKDKSSSDMDKKFAKGVMFENCLV